MINIGGSRHGFSIGVAFIAERVAVAFVTAASLRLCVWVYEVPFKEQYQALMIIAALLALILVRDGDSWESHVGNGFWSTAVSVAGSWLVVFAILLALGYATKSSAVYSRKALFTWALLAPTLLILTRITITELIFRITMSASNARSVVIAGADQLAASLAQKFMSHRQFGMSLNGFFDDRGIERLANVAPDKMLGRLQDLPEYAKQHAIDLIFIVLPIRNVQRVTELLDQLHDTTASIYFVPDVFVFDLIQCRTAEIDGIPVVALCETPFHGSRGIAKRASDFLIALLILIVTSPLFLAIAIAVKSTSPGSVIFKQRRYGLDGREIIVYKFRSMTVSEDSEVVRQATRDDERVTPIGAVLRKFSLDELPQFINVLQGRMSVVGPRPHAVTHNEEYRQLIKGYMVRHKVTPGITGLAQVRGFRGETSDLDAMRRRVECDLEYLRNWSLGLDIRIILKTIVMIFRDRAAY